MADESVLPRTEEWMELMTFYKPPDHLQRISSNEKLQSIMAALIGAVRPKEVKRKARHISLIQKQNGKELCKELEIMKKRNQLKEQLQFKEKELIEKRGEYTNLKSDTENILQEIQLTDSIVNDEKKKLLFVLLNEKALDDKTVQFKLLRQCVREAKEKENDKKEKLTSLDNSDEIREAVNECQSFIRSSRAKMEEQLENNKSIANEYGCNDTKHVAAQWKLELIEYVSKQIEKIPFNRVFEVVLEQQQQIINSIKLLPSCTNSDTTLTSKNYDNIQDENHIKALESNFFISTYTDLNSLPEVKSNSHLNQVVKDDSASVQKHSEDSASYQVLENLTLSESNLLDVENHIAEKAVECKTIKENLKLNLSEVLRRLSGVKQFNRRFQKSRLQDLQAENAQLLSQTNDLYKCIQELCKLGPKEIQLFESIPLIALEKVSLSNGKNVPVYELQSSYLRVLASSSKYIKSFFPVMNDKLAPYFLLLHCYNQMSYFAELQQAHSLMTPFAGSCENFRAKSDDMSGKLEEIHGTFLVRLSSFASKADEVMTLLEIMRSQPLNVVVPKDYLVEGQSIQFYHNLFNEAMENGNYFAEDSLEEL